MTKKELQEQVKFLQARINFLESLYTVKPNSIVSTWTTDCLHEYPEGAYWSTIPPGCKKCGKVPSYTVTTGFIAGSAGKSQAF